MLPVNAQSSFLHLSLFYFQPSPSIPRRDRSLPPQCGEAARRIGNKGVHLPCLPTHRSHPDPHKGVMQVARSDSPWGARDVAAALKSHGAAPKSRRRMMPDPPPPASRPSGGIWSATSRQPRAQRGSGCPQTGVLQQEPPAGLSEKAGRERTVPLESRRNERKAENCEVDEHSRGRARKRAAVNQLSPGSLWLCRAPR